MGGDFFYAPPTPANLLLIAGGVGINPLISMLQHHVWLLSKIDCHHDNRTHPIGAVQLLYSAKNERELIFKVFTCGALERSIPPPTLALSPGCLGGNGLLYTLRMHQISLHSVHINHSIMRSCNTMYGKVN